MDWFKEERLETHGFYVFGGGWALPLWKMMDFVNWDHEIPNWMESHKKNHVPNHQADWLKYSHIVIPQSSSSRWDGPPKKKQKVYPLVMSK